LARDQGPASPRVLPGGVGARARTTLITKPEAAGLTFVKPEGGLRVTYTVTRVRKEWSDRPYRHEHVEGVCAIDGTHYTRKEVVDSMAAANVWETFGGATRARIKPMASCPVRGCPATPYITTTPDHTVANNLDNLPSC
jgi:hypothetical protein